MPRQKRYIDTDVLTEARKRIEHLFVHFDSVVVSFSGGKDSLAVLHLVKEVHDEMGLPGKIKVLFRDEELIPMSVIEFVQKYQREPWVDMKYFAIPLASTKYVLGITRPYIQWDPDRPHVRPMPPDSIRLEPGDTRVFSQFNIDSYTASFYKGKIAIVTGIRASESLMRFQASVQKLNENWINTPTKYTPDQLIPANLKLCKPIFDWEENDVFRYFYDRKIAYNPYYDAQLYAGIALRVATPLLAESAKRFDGLRRVDPVLHDQIVQIFPEMQLQERYYREMDRKSVVADYVDEGFDGIERWINENIDDPKQKKVAFAQFKLVKARAINKPASYPIDYLLKSFMSGHYKRQILPMTVKKSKSA